VSKSRIRTAIGTGRFTVMPPCICCQLIITSLGENFTRKHHTGFRDVQDASQECELCRLLLDAFRIAWSIDEISNFNHGEDVMPVWVTSIVDDGGNFNRLSATYYSGDDTTSNPRCWRAEDIVMCAEGSMH
jgi:hypothetical protein